MEKLELPKRKQFVLKKERNMILVMNLRLLFKGFPSSYLLMMVMMADVISQPAGMSSLLHQTDWAQFLAPERLLLTLKLVL